MNHADDDTCPCKKVAGPPQDFPCPHGGPLESEGPSRGLTHSVAGPPQDFPCPHGGPLESAGPSRNLAYLADEKATEAFGAALAPLLTPGLVIWLVGDLGAGKTTLTRGLLRALGHTGNVKSPTYTLLEVYTVSRMSLYHFDFYRFAHPDEFLEAGLDEYFGGDGACLVEWADKAQPYVPQPDLEIHLHVAGEGRCASLSAHSPQGIACLSLLNRPS